jgi:hypothetical protein
MSELAPLAAETPVNIAHLAKFNERRTSESASVTGTINGRAALHNGHRIRRAKFKTDGLSPPPALRPSFFVPRRRGSVHRSSSARA